MNEKNRNALKTLAIWGSLFIYLAFVIYSEYHFYNLVQTFLPEGPAQLVGYLAVAVTGATAIFLPIALHFWVRAGMQKLVGWLFYAAHILFVGANMILDSAANAGTDLGGFFTIYGVYILPAVTAVYAIGWIAVWALDPGLQRLEDELEVQETEAAGRHQRRKLMAQMKTNAVAAAFGSRGAQQAVNRWAVYNAPRMIAEELGVSMEELSGNPDDYRWWGEEDGAAEAAEARFPGVGAGDADHDAVPAPTASANGAGPRSA